MKTVRNLLDLFEELFAGRISCMAFSYDFPNLMLELRDASVEKTLDDMPELCAFYSPYKDSDFDDDEILNDAEFLEKIRPIYYKLKIQIEENRVD